MIVLDSNFWSFIFNTHKIIEVGGLLLVLALIYIETGFFLGFVLPGGYYMLFAAGIFCGSHYLEISIFQKTETMRSIFKIAQEITNHKIFKVFILLLIFLSAILNGIETYFNQNVW